MAKYSLTNKAIDDLSGIWNDTVEVWSEYQADKYYRMLLNTCKDIAENPDAGKTYEGISHNLFGFKAGRYIVFFRKMPENEIEVIRILHERMDLKIRITE